MKQTSLIIKVAVTALAGLLLVSACGTMNKAAPGRKVDYKKSQTTESLEVPPDLTASSINEAPDLPTATGTSYSEISNAEPAAGTPTVLPEKGDMRVERDGNQQWLVIQSDPAQVWPKVREFWMQQGFLIKMEDPRLGILETGWAENRADIPSDIIRNTLGKVLDVAYSAATRDQYRVRLEHGATPGTTELYLTHRGMEEVVTGKPDEGGSTMWKPRAPDPELEAEMLKRLVVFLGVGEQQAETLLAAQPQTQSRAQLVSDSNGIMLIDKEDFSRAWRRTGVALDRVGFAVEDRNRTDGIYFVRYNDPLGDEDNKGLLSKLAFWSSDETKAKQYQIVLLAQGADTQVIVKDSEGKRENSSTAKRILTLLEEQLR
jgi:outer membrane protein assembly factor BamC